MSGQWNFNSNGQVTGTLIEQSGGTTNWNGIVLATIRDSRILKATVATTSGLFQWKGVPATTFPDLSGIWTGVVKVGKSPTTTSYLIESNSNGLFDIFPSTSTDTMIGQLLVGESDKIYGDLMIDGETFALSGTYNSRRASLVIAGIDVGREKISLKIVKQ